MRGEGGGEGFNTVKRERRGKAALQQNDGLISLSCLSSKETF